MSIKNAIKKINKKTLQSGDNAKLSIGFDSISDLEFNPSDIILIIDKSSSMIKNFDSIKKEITKLIDNVVASSRGIKDKNIGNKSRIGLISFSNTSNIVCSLTNDVKKLKNSLNNIELGGLTNHYLAFDLAFKMIKNSDNLKKIVMISDGNTTLGKNSLIKTVEIKNNNIDIFCVSNSFNKSLNLWSSKPSDYYILNSNNITDNFDFLTSKLVLANTMDVVIVEKLNNEFNINSIIDYNIGEVEINDNHTLTWSINSTKLGKACLSIDISYVGNKNGLIYINKDIIYKDKYNNILNFPNPLITVNSDRFIIENEIISKNINFEKCVNFKILEFEDLNVSNYGRIIKVDIPLNNVCPNKKIGLGLMYYEITLNEENLIGTQTIVINPLKDDECKNILIKDIYYVIPEKTLCESKKFKVKVIINYLGNNLEEISKNDIITGNV